MKASFDVIVVGMAHAYTAAKQGLRVLLVDTDHHAAGASVRNFGFITVTGQKGGGGLAICQTLGRNLALRGS